MQVSDEEYLRLTKEQPEKLHRTHRSFPDAGVLMDLLQQASIKHGALTGNPDWDYYLSSIQAWIDRTEQQKVQFERMLGRPELTNQDDIARVRNSLFLCDERINVLKAVINFPKQIIEAGERAKLMLNDLPGEKTDQT